MAIKIPVSAEFDAADLKKQIQMVNDQVRILGNQVAMANKQKFEPITLKSKDDLKLFVGNMQKMLKVQTELNNKMNQTGQKGRNPLFADWNKLYRDKETQLKKIQEVLQFAGMQFDDLPPPKEPPSPNPKPTRQPRTPAPRNQRDADFPSWGQQGMNVINSGLRAAGPVGGVFSSALGTGMSGGAAAGLMGLVGGMAALFVGKLVGAIAEKVKDAEVESVTIDRIIRLTGDRSRYRTTRDTIREAASELGVSYNEMGNLASGFARTANLGPGDQIAPELLTGGGMARAYGLDLQSGLNFTGGLRGANITRNDRDSRRIGLIIGETLAKAGVFGKADEMMTAISQYAIAQARQSLTTPDIGMYGGAMASLLSPRNPGMDVTGAAALLGHVNQAFLQGGNAGDAGQFFFQRMANRMGLDPFQLRVMREGGMFATQNQMFGKGSQYAGTFGNGPQGNRSMIDMAMEEFRRSYSNPRDRIMGMSNLFGIGINQAMALNNMQPRTMNGVSNRLSRLGIDLSSVNQSGIETLGRIENGDQANVARELLARTGQGALSQKERQQLIDTMQHGSKDDLKDMTALLAAQKGQRETEGSKTRNSIANVGNIMQQYASKALPYLNDARMALINMTGKGPNRMRNEFLQSEHDENVEAIRARGDANIKAASRALREHGKGQDYGNKEWTSREEVLQAEVERQKKIMESELEGEEQRFRVDVHKERLSQQAQQARDSQAAATITRGAKYDPLFKQVSQETGIPVQRLKALAMTESHFNPNAYNKKSKATGMMQVLPSNARPGEDLTDPLTNIRVGARVYQWAMEQANGDPDEAARWYNGGKYRGSAENREYAGKVNNAQQLITRDDRQQALKNDSGSHITADPVQVQLVHPDGRQQNVVAKTRVVPKNNFRERP